MIENITIITISACWFYPQRSPAPDVGPCTKKYDAKENAGLDARKNVKTLCQVEFSKWYGSVGITPSKVPISISFFWSLLLVKSNVAYVGVPEGTRGYQGTVIIVAPKDESQVGQGGSWFNHSISGSESQPTNSGKMGLDILILHPKSWGYQVKNPKYILRGKLPKKHLENHHFS